MIHNLHTFLKEHKPVALILIVYVVLILIYFINFPYGISKDQNDWAAFGAYFGAVSSFVVIAFNFYFIFWQQKKEQSRFKLNLSMQDLIKLKNDYSKLRGSLVVYYTYNFYTDKLLEELQVNILDLNNKVISQWPKYVIPKPIRRNVGGVMSDLFECSLFLRKPENKSQMADFLEKQARELYLKIEMLDEKIENYLP